LGRLVYELPLDPTRMPKNPLASSGVISTVHLAGRHLCGGIFG